MRLTLTHPLTLGPRLAADAFLLLALCLFMGAVGPYGTDYLAPVPRYLYWSFCIVGGGAIGVAIDEFLGRRFGAVWRRVGLTSLLMTPLVAVHVMLVRDMMFGAHAPHPNGFALLLWQVLVISVLVMTVRALVWRSPRTVVETRTVVAPPLPEAEAAFRTRLTARRRAARLIAIEAHDHYLKVHTDAGSELVTLRFADALAELSGAHGFQVHRSWWVAADAIQSVRWRRGTGEARLAGDLVVPVSRSQAPALKAAGWF